MKSMRLTKNAFQTMVDRALRDLPPRFSCFLQNVVIEIESVPDPATCRSLGIADPYELMGLYHGTPLTERSVDDGASLPDRITIYQRSIEAVTDSTEDIVEEIRTTVLHEIGHHFGLDEDDLEKLGYE